MTDHFPKGSVIRRVNIEPAIALGAGRALVLQLANPAVAQGVADHSQFQRNPFTRLQGTLEATYATVFGSEDLAAGVGRRLQWIHSHIVGPGYAANDPEHLLWVHATLVDTALGCYEDLVAPLSPADAETYYREMQRVGEVFGVGLEHQPASLEEFRRYMASQVERLVVSEAGHDLIAFVLDPTLPLRLHRPLGPILGRQRLLTLGSLPSEIRDQLDVRWDLDDQARYERARRRIRRVLGAVPTPIRTAPNVAVGPVLLAQAARHVRASEARAPGAQQPSAA